MKEVVISYPSDRDKLFVFDQQCQAKVELASGSIAGKILYIYDVPDDEILANIYNKWGYPLYTVIDSMTEFHSTLDNQILTVDAWLESELKLWENKNAIQVDNNFQTNYSAGFMVNKKQINRYLLVKLCEVFNLNVSYTWSGIGKNYDLSYVIKEKQGIKDSIIDEYFPHILAPIKKFNQKWIADGTVTHLDSGSSSVEDFGVISDVWNNGGNSVLSQCAISLIGESIWTQKASTFTEKTAFSVLAHTFPIWVGGYNMANGWKDKGFDIFDDIIDHSYQCMPTVLERCFYAFYLNREILSNLELATSLRNQFKERFAYNRTLLTSDNLKKYNRKVIKTWPAYISKPIMEAFQQSLGLNYFT